MSPGLICDSSTTPHTLRIDFGTTAGKVAEGGDVRFPDPDKGKYLGSFTPTINQSNPPTLAAPGGQIAGITGQIIYNALSGRVGVRAGDEICSAITDFSGITGAVASAHACSPEELMWNVNKGYIEPPLTGTSYTLASYVARAGAPDDSAWEASCANWTYNTGDIAAGTSFSVVSQALRNNLAADKNITIKFTSGQPCNTVLPIACCR